MAQLIYTGITSLDGYLADEDGNFDWSTPDDEVHDFVNQLEKSTGTYLYGRRMYQVMMAWDHLPTLTEQPQVVQDYARLWQAADKIVYSTTLQGVSSARTRLVRSFDPAEVLRLKASSNRDLSIGGPELAAQAIQAGLVDEVRMLVSPIAVGGGIPFLPHGVRLPLHLVGERRFGNGVVHLRYHTLR